MATVLVTGGTGTLGRQVVPRLLEGGHAVRVLSRRSGGAGPAETVTGDLATGAGLDAALSGVSVVVHCAGSPVRSRQVDVAGTRRLITAASASGRPHLVYISIVGVDRHPFRFYRDKLAAEQLIEESGIPHTILRTTQFHDLMLLFLRVPVRLPVVPVARGFRFQAIDTSEVAERLAELAGAGPQGRVADMGGPAVRRIEDLARALLAARRRRRPVVGIPVPGRVARAFRECRHCCPDRAVGRITWEEFLQRRLS